MKLTLRNFKHHRDNTFTFPEKGLVLISGHEGVGKTTIFKAIIYALYGVAKKPNSYDTKSCEVTLEFKDMIITRSNHPRRLLVSYEGKEYEDSGAQGVINHILGIGFEEFMASSYIVQRSYNSVISMTPTEQSKFIKVLAYKSKEHTEYREKFKENVKKWKKIRDELKIGLDFLDKNISEQEENLPENPPSPDDILIEDVKNEQEELLKNLSLYESNISDLKESLKKVKNVEELSSSLKENRNKLDIEINNLLSMRSRIEKVKSSEEIEEIEKKLEDLKTKLFNTKSYLSYKEKIEKAEEFRNAHFEELKNKIEDLNSKLLPKAEREKLYKSLENREKERIKYEKERELIQKEKLEREYALNKFKKIHSEAKKLYPKQINKIKNKDNLLIFLEEEEKIISQKINSISKTIEELNEKISQEKIIDEIYVCPCCSVNLQIKDGYLLKVEEIKKNNGEESRDYNLEIINEKMSFMDYDMRKKDVGEWIKSLREIVKILKKKLTIPKVKYNHLKHIEDEKIAEEYRRIEREISLVQEQLDKKDVPPLIKSLFEEAEDESKKFPSKFKIDEGDDIIKIIEEEINETTSELEKVWRSKSEYSSISRELKSKKEKLKAIEKRLPVKRHLSSVNDPKNSKDIEEEINNIQKQSIFCSTRLAELQNIFKAVTEYDSYREKCSVIEKLKSRREKLLTELEKSNKKLEGAMGLEECGREAEILAMKATITSINEHAKFYLDRMFSEPVSVTLQSHKVTSKGERKIQINTSVVYKGYDSSIDDISGGQSQGCELAFLLGVNDMLGSSLILLDECLNNLGEKTNMKTLVDLRDFAGDKLILVSSHEAIKGVFDEIVELS